MNKMPLVILFSLFITIPSVCFSAAHDASAAAATAESSSGTGNPRPPCPPGQHDCSQRPFLRAALQKQQSADACKQQATGAAHTESQSPETPLTRQNTLTPQEVRARHQRELEARKQRELEARKQLELEAHKQLELEARKQLELEQDIELQHNLLSIQSPLFVATLRQMEMLMPEVLSRSLFAASTSQITRAALQKLDKSDNLHRNISQYQTAHLQPYMQKNALCIDRLIVALKLARTVLTEALAETPSTNTPSAPHRPKPTASPQR